ncbi:MAG: prolyl oligopeptidase family serine peptidase [Clostridiaceae bacterium]|jgi:cephalosporin-C deacetylase-like acetyl esterase|nr:prolyl oligopeptidase family serine peptidase [Clostridiaceae bacterium]
MYSREKVIECLGEFPDKCSINSEIIGQHDCGTHYRYLVRYNVEPDERINAYLLVPKNLKEKNPAIIAPHQHNDEFQIGKSEVAGLTRNSAYHYGLDLCLKGYVVLCPDHLGFEDRRPPGYIRYENRHLEGMNYERYIFCKYILKGSSLQAKYLSDLVRGVDLLESLSYVDNKRIGAIGHSLGGQEALWLAWYDDRIKVTVSSCGFSQIKNIIRDGINHNYAMYSFGFLKYCDIGDIVCDLAPKPFLMTNGTEDYIFPLDGAYEIAEAASRAYENKGYPDYFKSIVFEGVHSFPKEVKEQAYDWIDRFLMK